MPLGMPLREIAMREKVTEGFNGNRGQSPLNMAFKIDRVRLD